MPIAFDFCLDYNICNRDTKKGEKLCQENLLLQETGK